MPDTVIERREPPQWIVDRTTSLGGSNRFSKPNFRVIWGGNRTHLVGGLFKKVIEVDGKPVVTQVAEMRTLLKYHAFRWHLEKWFGPEAYGMREDWYRDTWNEEAQLHSMGDYPVEGEYEHVFFLGQCSHMKPQDKEWCLACQVGMGEYIPLEENFYLIELQINMLRLSENIGPQEQKDALFAREHKKIREERSQTEAIVRNAMRPGIALQPTSWQPGTNGPCSVPEAKFNPKIYQPLGRSSFRQRSAHQQTLIELPKE